MRPLVHLPSKLYYGLGALVFAYGVFHLVYGTRLAGRARLSHVLRGALFLLLGAYVIASGRGFHLFGG